MPTWCGTPTQHPSNIPRAAYYNNIPNDERFFSHNIYTFIPHPPSPISEHVWRQGRRKLLLIYKIAAPTVKNKGIARCFIRKKNGGDGMIHSNV